jgi:hypothetical protein
MAKPIYMMCAANVAPYLHEAVKDAVQMIIGEVGYENLIKTIDLGAWSDPGYILDGVYQKYKSMDWYILATKHYSERENQIDAGILLNFCQTEPWRIDHPHYDVILVADDMYYQKNSFIIGLSGLGLGIIVSTYRFMDLPQQEQIECIKTVALHELGHVFGAIHSKRIQAVEDKLGRHCTNVCVLRQGLVVPRDWLQMTKDRVRSGRPFCDECIAGMRRYLGQ